MHDSVMEWIKLKLGQLKISRSKVLEVGSLNVNGSVRELFTNVESYVGVDFREGPGVDKVMNGHDLQFEDSYFDVVISTEMLEHDDEFWVSVREMGRVLKPGGFLFLTARGNGFEKHEFPADYWRFMPDGFSKLLRVAQCETVAIMEDPQENHPGMFALGKKIQDKPVTNLESCLDFPFRRMLQVIQNRIMGHSTYFGVPTWKIPTDFWMYQELICELKPDVIIEIGNRYGGSALALAHLCDGLNHGRIIGVDIDHSFLRELPKAHPRITFIEGDACASHDKVSGLIKPGENVLVIEDSLHTKGNTIAVLNAYNHFVKPGGYFIVEDGICHHGLDAGPSPGPYEAIDEFVASNSDFVVDRSREAFVLAWNLKGYLKRIK